MITRNQLKVTISNELPENYHGQRWFDWESNAEFWATYIDYEGSRRMLLHEIAQRVAQLIPNSPSATRILDLGTGEGMFLRLCHNNIPDAELIGVDFSLSMLNTAAKRSSTLPISFMLGDFEDEEFELNDKFDVVTSVFTFDEASDLLTSFASVSKHLKLEGVVVIAILDPVLELFRYDNFQQPANEGDSKDRKTLELKLISKHFNARSTVSPAPYHRILRPVADYTTAAKMNGLVERSFDRIAFGIASGDSLVGPIANILTFGKKDVL